MTNKEFMMVVQWKMIALADFCRSHRGNYVAIMNFKKEFQQALALYSKHHKYDMVQEKAIAIINKIEKWVKQVFIKDAVIRVFKEAPDTPPNKAKQRARYLWEIYNRKMSY